MGRFKIDKRNVAILFFLVSILGTGLSCETHNNDRGLTVLYKNDKEGNTLLGSKSKVVNAIRKGADIKIGWQSVGKTRKIEHLSTPVWLAVLNEREVVAYLDPQIFATMDWDNLSASYIDYKKLDIEWRVVLTTSGNFDAVWYDRKADTVIRRVPQNHQMTWFGRY